MHPQELSIRIGEADYIFSALTFKDWESFSTACQFQRYERAKAANGSQAMLDKVFLVCAEHTPTPAETDAFTSSASGMREIFYLSIRRKQPHLTRDQVSDLFRLRDDTVKTISDWVVKVSLPDPPKKEGEAKNGEAAVAG